MKGVMPALGGLHMREVYSHAAKFSIKRIINKEIINKEIKK